MRYEKYDVEASEDLIIFDFISIGPKGLIEKRIQFQKVNDSDIYNLAFGDVKAETQDFDDTSISNNNDTEKVLATVAATVYSFTDRYPNALVFATGSTSVRTRLYRIGISKNLEELKEKFDVFGMLDNNVWVEYEKDMPYTAFYITKKI
jgi:hypothetical protein